LLQEPQDTQAHRCTPRSEDSNPRPDARGLKPRPAEPPALLHSPILNHPNSNQHLRHRGRRRAKNQREKEGGERD
ncbi:hypothetical protein KUCAC02_031671, partial [Chaenocephalus aceratus]